MADLHTLHITAANIKFSTARSVFNSRFLVKVINNGDSSASHAQVLLLQPPIQNSLNTLNCQLSTKL
jgi:hypothetical protein